LDALENDNADDAPDPFGLAEGDDDEFVMGDSDEDGKRTGSLTYLAAAASLHAFACLQASGINPAVNKWSLPLEQPGLNRKWG
jgi:hypothetical protein